MPSRQETTATAVLIGVGAVLLAALGPALLRVGAELIRLLLPMVVVALGIILAIGVSVLVVCRWLATPHDLPAKLPAELRVPARVAWMQRLFLGWSGGLGAFAMAGTEDSVGVVGPPGYRKTLGVITPAIALWDGPLISTSIKPEVLRATAQRRLALAQARGGTIHVYDPTAKGLVEGIRPVRWSPLDGCEDDVVCALRVNAFIKGSRSGKGVEDGNHWSEGSARCLRGLFHAAAHHPERPGAWPVLVEWLNGEVTGADLASQATAGDGMSPTPISILTSLDTDAGDLWASELAGLERTAPRERSGFWSAARTALAAASTQASVLASCSATELDIRQFLLSSSTLYINSSTAHQESVGNLMATLINSIVTTAFELDAQGELPYRLALMLDEAANLAPLPQLMSWLSQGRGQGLNILYGVQSLSQLEETWGKVAGDAIWSATRAKVMLGGLADEPSLEKLSRLIGDHEVKTVSRTKANGKVQITTGTTWRPRLSVAELRRIEPGWALLIYGHMAPLALRVPLASFCRQFREVLRGWRPDPTPGPETERSELREDGDDPAITSPEAG